MTAQGHQDWMLGWKKEQKFALTSLLGTHPSGAAFRMLQGAFSTGIWHSQAISAIEEAAPHTPNLLGNKGFVSHLCSLWV